MMTHILFNLLKNALYYIEASGKGDIHIWLENDEGKNTLHFKDTGPGISATLLPSIFERFFSRRKHGTGMGLAFCKSVMQEIRGDIQCRSKEGEYTEFVLTFPTLLNTKLKED
jgi:signal transduction histidine kinase